MQNSNNNNNHLLEGLDTQNTSIEYFAHNALFQTNEWYSKSVKFLIGNNATAPLECYGVIHLMTEYSRYFNTLIIENQAKENLHTEQLHLLQNINVTGTLESFEAFKHVWNYMNGLKLHTYRHASIHKSNCFGFLPNRKRKLEEKENTKCKKVYSSNFLSHDKWDYEFKVLQHMKEYIDYFAIYAGSRVWMEYFLALLSVCPYRTLPLNETTNEETKTKQKEIMQYIESIQLKFKQNVIEKYFPLLRQAFKYLIHQCVFENCSANISNFGYKKWKSMNGFLIDKSYLIDQKAQLKLSMYQRCTAHQNVSFRIIDASARFMLKPSTWNDVFDSYLYFRSSETPRMLLFQCHLKVSKPERTIFIQFNSISENEFDELKQLEQCNSTIYFSNKFEDESKWTENLRTRVQEAMQSIYCYLKTIQYDSVTFINNTSIQFELQPKNTFQKSRKTAPNYRKPIEVAEEYELKNNNKDVDVCMFVNNEEEKENST